MLVNFWGYLSAAYNFQLYTKKNIFPPPLFSNQTYLSSLAFAHHTCSYFHHVPSISHLQFFRHVLVGLFEWVWKCICLQWKWFIPNCLIFVTFYAMPLACGWITSSATFLGLSEWVQGARFSSVKAVLVHIVPPCLIFVMYLLCHEGPCLRLDDTCCEYIHFFRLILGVVWMGTKCLLSLVKVGFSTYSPTPFDLCYLLCPCPPPAAQWHMPRCCIRPLSSTTFFNLRGYLSGCWVHLSSVKVVLIHTCTVPPVPLLLLSIPPCRGRWRHVSVRDKISFSYNSFFFIGW